MQTHDTVQMVSCYHQWPFIHITFCLSVSSLGFFSADHMELRCPPAIPLHNNILQSSLPPSVKMKQKKKRRSSLLLAFWKSGLWQSIKVHIIKTHFERRITASIWATDHKSHFSNTKCNGNYEKAISPLGRIGTPIALLPLCFLMLACKQWDTALQIVDTLPYTAILTLAPQL